MNAVQWKH